MLTKQPDGARVRYALASALTYLQRYDEAAAEARRAVALDPAAKHARTLLSILDWSYWDPTAASDRAPPETFTGDPLGELTLEVHLRDAPTPGQRAALAAAVADWYAEGAAGGFRGGAFLFLAGPEDDGPILRWRLDLDGASPGAMQTLATRLAGLSGAPVARMLTKQPKMWAFWQP